MGEDKSLFTPEDILQYAARRRGVDKKAFQVPNRLVLVYRTNAFERLKRILNGRIREWVYGEFQPLSIGIVNGKEIGAFRAWVGAPAAAFMLEELIACGAKKIFEIGMAGGLQPQLNLET